MFTDKRLRYWLDQEYKTDSNGNLLYPYGPMRAAYGTFLTSLLMIKAHDMVADQAAAEFNVTWSRTTPIVVSVFDDAYSNVMTLECDHRFGIDVVGDPENILSFRYACSAAINPIEHWVMETLFPGGDGTSITIGLGKEIFNGQMPDIFMSNGNMVTKSENNTLFLVFDSETGILRDVMMLNNTVSGAGCFSDLQTEWATDFGEVILGYELLIMDIFNGDVTIDFSHLATNIKIGLTSFINSAMISLEIANNLFNLKDSPFNILGVCLMNSRIDVYKDSIGDSWSPVTY